MRNEEKKDASKPVYVAPQVIRLHDVAEGIGGNCGLGGSPSAGNCNVGNGPGGGSPTCAQGNGAQQACSVGNGVKI